MARDGSGNYNLPAGQPVVTSTTISSTVHNTFAADVAAALTQSLSKDGQTTPTANLPMGTFRHTGVGDGSARTMYSSIGQLQDHGPLTIGSVAGTNTITGSLVPAITAYVTGMEFLFIPASTNTGAATIALNGLVARNIVKFGGAALVAGDLVAGAPALIAYDGTNFLLVNPGQVGNAQLADMAQATVKGRQAGAGTGDAEDLTAAQLVTIILAADGAGSLLDADFLDGLSSAAFALASHTHAAGDITSGTFADARIAQSSVTQHQAALALAASQTTSGTFADARIAQSNVTQHQAALAINTDQLTTDYADDASTSYTLGSGDAESIRRFTSSSAVTITLPNSTPSGWAIGDSFLAIRGGTGTVTFSSAGTIRSPGGGVAITLQNGKVAATLAAAGVWELSGNI